MACDIPLESSWQGLRLCFRLHLNRKSTCKVMDPKVGEVPIVGISKLSLGSPGTKWHLGIGPMAMHKVYYKREGGAFPKSEAWWSLWVHVCPWFVYALKCSNYTLTNLLFGFCKSMWVIELFVNLPSPILELQHAPLPSKCYKPGNVPQPVFLSMLTFGLTIESIKELRGASEVNSIMALWCEDFQIL